MPTFEIQHFPYFSQTMYFCWFIQGSKCSPKWEAWLQRLEVRSYMAYWGFIWFLSSSECRLCVFLLPPSGGRTVTFMIDGSALWSHRGLAVWLALAHVMIAVMTRPAETYMTLVHHVHCARGQLEPPAVRRASDLWEPVRISTAPGPLQPMGEQ